jgi:epoxyqueuosine reductase
MKAKNLRKILEPLAVNAGISHFGWTALKKPLGAELYKAWLEKGFHGAMQYLQNHLPAKLEPENYFVGYQSVISIAIPIIPHPEPQERVLEASRVAAYAQGADYHYWFKHKLTVIATDLKKNWPEVNFQCFTDSAPLPERDLAVQAGLGWVGKNTCVIHPKKGSYFLIGEILVDCKIEEDPETESVLVADYCGTCTRCIDICPTQALNHEKQMDARKCISYLTIESRKVPEVTLREKIGDWLFGCDLCQSICPWNAKPFKIVLEQNKALLELDETKEIELKKELLWILSSSGKAIEKAVQKTPLARAGSFGLKRNAIIVVTNRKLLELAPAIKLYLEHPKLAELATWSLEKLGHR